MCNQASQLSETDQRTATKAAQDLVKHWQGVADAQRVQIENLAAAARIWEVYHQAHLTQIAKLTKERDDWRAMAERLEAAQRGQLAQIEGLTKAMDEQTDIIRELQAFIGGDPLDNTCVSSNSASSATSPLEETQAGLLAYLQHDLDETRRALRGSGAELDELRALAQAVIDSAARELNYSPDVLLVSTAALRALGKAL